MQSVEEFLAYIDGECEGWLPRGDDHLAYLERPFLEALAALEQRLRG